MEQKDGTTALALSVVAGVVALVITLVLALVVAAPSAEPPPAAAANRPAPRFHPTPAIATLSFASGSAKLPAKLAGPLLKILGAARLRPTAKVRIAGLHDGERELARERELALSMALIGAGLSQERIILDEPVATRDQHLASRVEVFLVDRSDQDRIRGWAPASAPLPRR